MKILYAANNLKSSYYPLKQFLDNFRTFYDLKIAGYSKSIQNLNANYNLDALLDCRGSGFISFENSNFRLYAKEIEKFKPDLIISDLEIFTSYIGIEKNIPVFQVSSLLLYYGMKSIWKSSLNKYYSFLFARNSNHKHYLKYIINNSNERLIFAHWGDLKDPPQIKEGFKWIRPSYSKINSKIETDGNIIDLANAYYNEVPSVLDINYNDQGCILNANYNLEYGLSSKIGGNIIIPCKPHLNNNVQFLSQILKNFDINRSKR